ncbi:MAG: hypothetical protein FJ217_16960, partial [Ignavibacteria bacterium]|nr:hypothetical protein [Ignavibacteria bacterium]
MKMHLWQIFLLAAFLALGQDQQGDATAQEKRGSPFSQAKFVPDISLILDCSFVRRNLSNEEFQNVMIPGVARWTEPLHAKKGFNLNYGEITFFSVVDPYFDLFAVCHVAEHHFGLEEAYGLTRKLPLGLQLKVGKFLSSFGRINDQHSHYWDFADQPLVCGALFGEEGLSEIGGRVTWVAPLEAYLLLGAEILEGRNAASFGLKGFQVPQLAASVSGIDGPGLLVGYIKSSVDVEDASVLAGLSVARGMTRRDDGFSSGDQYGRAFSGNTALYGCDVTVKYPLDPIRSVSVQGEYLWRDAHGTLYLNEIGEPVTRPGSMERLSGLYAQAVMKADLRWRLGLRYDLVQTDEAVMKQFGLSGAESLTRISAMIEFNPTEFSRIRLQYNVDNSRYDFSGGVPKKKAMHELILQVNL